MTQPEKKQMEYEKINCSDFTTGVIADVMIDLAHTFKFKDKESVHPGVRFKFELNGYQYPKFSRWMKFNYGEKANLYKKYLYPLVEGAVPDMDFEIESLIGMDVKILWSENVYQDKLFYNVETIRPAKSKMKLAGKVYETESVEDVPF